MILFYNGFSNRIPSQSRLVRLLTKSGRVEESVSATASQRRSFIVETIKLQNPEKILQIFPKTIYLDLKNHWIRLIFPIESALRSQIGILGCPHPGYQEWSTTDRWSLISASINRVGIPHIHSPRCPTEVPPIRLIVDRTDRLLIYSYIYIWLPIAIASDLSIRSDRRSAIRGSIAQCLSPPTCNLWLWFGLKA